MINLITFIRKSIAQHIVGCSQVLKIAIFFSRLADPGNSSLYANLFKLQNRTLTVGKTGDLLDFEKFPVFSVIVTTTDSGSPPLSFTGVIRIVLQDVNDQPRNISLSNAQVLLLILTQRHWIVYIDFYFIHKSIILCEVMHMLIFIPPANEVAGVYNDPYVRPFVRSFLRPSLPISNPLLL